MSWRPSYDEFDPLDYVKSAKNRESAVEIYNGPLVRVIQPLAAFTINNYLPDHAAWDEKYFRAIAQVRCDLSGGRQSAITTTW
jgi:hypothetical protein